MAMECAGNEPAQAARELVVRDRSPNDGESTPREFGPSSTAPDFPRVLSVGSGPCGGARDPGQDADQEAGVEARGANRRTPPARHCDRLPVV